MVKAAVTMSCRQNAADKKSQLLQRIMKVSNTFNCAILDVWKATGAMPTARALIIVPDIMASIPTVCSFSCPRDAHKMLCQLSTA